MLRSSVRWFTRAKTKPKTRDTAPHITAFAAVITASEPKMLENTEKHFLFIFIRLLRRGDDAAGAAVSGTGRYSCGSPVGSRKPCGRPCRILEGTRGKPRVLQRFTSHNGRGAGCLKLHKKHIFFKYQGAKLPQESFSSVLRYRSAVSKVTRSPGSLGQN